MEVVADVEATVEGLRPYLIHGEPFAVVYYAIAGDTNTIHSCQLSADALPDGLQVGDAIVVHIVMGVAAAITRRSSAGDHGSSE
jgi:hypothetical protein